MSTTARSGCSASTASCTPLCTNPCHYGFVPGPRAGDGAPVDILVHGPFESFPEVLIEARPVGMLLMRDEKGDDEKVLAVPVADPRYREIRSSTTSPLTSCTRRSISSGSIKT